MLNNIQKKFIIFSIAICFFEIMIIPIVSFVSISVNASEIKKEVKVPTLSEFFEEEDSQTVEPIFSITHSSITGVVNEPVYLSISSNQETEQVAIDLPQEAMISEDFLSVGISIERDNHYWLVNSDSPQILFLIPIVFEEAGIYEVNVGNEKATFEIGDSADLYDDLNESKKLVQEDSYTENSDEEEQKDEIKNQSDQVNIIEVNTFADFQAAVRNSEISEISVVGDITAPTTGVVNLSRTTSLTIDGNDHTIDMRGNYISIPAANLSQGGELIFNNINFVGNSLPSALVQISIFNPNPNQWTAKFHNVTTNTLINRLVWNTYGRVELSGNVNLNTRFENIITGDVKIHDNTNYYGLVNFADVSTIYYEGNPRSTDVAFENNAFDIGENAVVQLGQTQTLGTTHPAIYLFYKQLTVGENSIFNVTMPGNAVRLQKIGARMDVKAGALVNLTSRSTSGSVVAFSRSNTTISVEPEASFYVIGNSTRPLIDMASNDLGTGHVAYTGNEFILDQPKNFDIRNLASGSASIAVSVAVNNLASNRFVIRHSDIDLWNVSSNPLGPSDSNFTEVEEFQVTGRGTQQTVSTTTDGLQSFNQNTVRRISGMSQLPSAVFEEEITDAHLTIKARVIVGYVPDNEGANSDGDVNYIPVYASKGQATGTIVDSFGTEHTDLVTDSEGYISYLSDDFNLAGETIIAKDIKVGSRQSEESAETVVVDVTPPTPATVDGEIYEDSSEIIGFSEEVDVLVEYTINGELAKNLDGDIINTEVDSEGKWQLPIVTSSISEGDEVQIFLTDKTGNRNPTEEQKLFDATFPPATRVSVLGKKIVAPVDPLDPEIEVNPENKPELPEDQGQLSIDFISSFNFGLQTISVHDQTYYAQPQRLLNEDGTVNDSEERPNYVQISDRRPENERYGWTLAVTQKEQFEGEENQVLNGASLSLSNQQVITAQGGEAPGLQSRPVTLVPGNRRTLLQSQGSEGTGTWIYRFGDGDTADESVALDVPRGANPEATTYSSTLIWELSAVPGN